MKNDDLIIRKTFNCSKRQLFDAWSKASIMAQWFFAASEKFKNSTVESNFTVNGKFSVKMYFENGTDSQITGHYKEIIRYSLIVLTWNSSIARDSLVKLNFKEISPNRTELVLVQSLFPSEESRQAHNNGWDACLANLTRFIDSVY
ncbi:SRPBCC family protein [Aliikangiella coralliicola]|nr:SRPBCC domain-containing protein [Aliikangiella coralliicola]